MALHVSTSPPEDGVMEGRLGNAYGFLSFIISSIELGIVDWLREGGFIAIHGDRRKGDTCRVNGGG